MNQLIRHIEYLISRNECVVIPRLGALLAQYSPARVDEAAGVIYPPCRNFTFNSGIRDNDASLALSISHATGISCQRAIDYVNKEVDSMIHQLHSYGTLSLGRAGTLHYNQADGTCEFEPFAGSRLCLATAWLPTVSAELLSSADTADTSDIDKKPAARVIWTRISRVAAVVAVLLGVWVMASTPISLDNESVLPASLAPDISRAKSAPAIISATQKVMATEESPATTQETVADALTEASLPSPASSEEAAPCNNTVGEMDHGRFYIIIGATVSEDEARKFIDMRPEIKDEATILKYGKKHVISISVHDTPQEANSACLETRKTYPTAWIGTN